MSQPSPSQRTAVTRDDSHDDDHLPEVAEPQVDDYFSTLRTYVRMAARGEQHGVLVTARPGIGKSYQIEEVLRDEVRRDDSPCWDYSIKAGYVSPLALYETLYEQQADGNVLVLDDTEGIASSDTAASLVKAALEGQGSGDRRVVEWDSNSSRLDDDVPERFEFRGSLVLVFNDVPDGTAHWDAVESRCMTYEMSLTFDERMNLIREVAKAPYDGLSYSERIETANWLIRNTTSEMDHVDLRSLFKTFDLRASSVVDGDEWKLHAAEQLGIDKETILARECEREHDSVAAAARAFVDRTHHSTRRFFDVLGEETEVSLVAELEKQHAVARDAIAEWEQLTSRSRKTYYRRRETLADRGLV